MLDSLLKDIRLASAQIQQSAPEGPLQVDMNDLLSSYLGMSQNRLLLGHLQNKTSDAAKNPIPNLSSC